MLFVVEVYEPNETRTKFEHNASYIMEQSSVQYYDVGESSNNYHFQLLSTQLDNYISRLDAKGFKRVMLYPTSHRQVKHPSKHYAILPRGERLDVGDAEVVNNLDGDPVLSRLVSRIPFQDIAQRMFIEEYNELLKDDGKQRNLCYDIGYTLIIQSWKV